MAEDIKKNAQEEEFVRPDFFRESDVKFTGGDKPWRWKEDGMTVTRTAAWAAPGCHDGCGVLVYTDKNGRLVKVEGDEENPFYNGRLCIRCLALPEVEYHPDRLLYPMKRDKADRGKNKWQRISWDEAYDIIETEFNKIKGEYGPESVVFSCGTGRGTAPYLVRICYSFGSPNYAYYLSGASCYVPRIAASNTMMGTYTVPDCSQYFIDRYDHPGWQPPAVIFIWGNNPLVSNADGNMGHWIIDCMKRGSKLVVVDPRLTWLASKADLWLQLRPGTDAALAMAMADTIIKEGIYDKDFVENWCYGFEEYSKRVAEYPVEKAARITWVPEEKIRRAARMMAQKPVSVQWGLALDMTKEAIPGSLSVASLWCITGNIDIPGGMIPTHQPFNIQTWNPPDPKEMLPLDVCEKRIGGKEYPMYEYGGVVLSQTDMTVDAMLTGKPYPIKGNFMLSTNPIACTGMQPETKMLKGFLNADINVVLDVFMTPTIMACADIVLPVATFPERDGIRSIYYYVQTINKAMEPVGECKSDMQITYELGKRFNPEAWPGDTLTEFFSHTMKEIGMSFEETREQNWVYPEYEYHKYENGKQRFDGIPGFNTPTGRIELYSTLFDEWGLEPLPFFEEPEEGPLSSPELMQEFPYVLTTGARHWSYFHSEHRQISRLRSLRPDPLVEMHPKTAAANGIKEGDWCWIENRLGKVKMRAKLSVGIDPRVVNCDHAWWYPERDPEKLYDVFEANVNQLVPAKFGRSGFGSNSKSLICKVYKAE
ncbi:molybdopterin-dependent oxidoreductase [Dehalobacter sp. DCM]|uniref:molybdopterin-dependent oxidoreductase n=1 Tax=Dehalobacter sp. DCM TaxID=2907827 RepID=UPI003081DB9D|nr:molybdopterin-dependent oxidoreductase [Dehalobacter sp. DCM]